MKPGPKPKGRSPANLRLSPSVLSGLTEYAESVGISRNDAAERLLSKALEQEEPTMSAYIAIDAAGNEFKGSLKPLIQRGIAFNKTQSKKGNHTGWTIRRESDGAVARFSTDPGGLVDSGYSLDDIIDNFLSWE